MRSRSSIFSSERRGARFTVRLGAFGVLLLGVQIALGLWTEASFPELASLDRYLEEGAEVIYFGDSTLRSYAPTDRAPTGIPELLQELVPGRSIRAVDHSAYHLGLYRAFCEYVRRAGAAPKAVIIPINLGWLSAAWVERPEHRFAKESVILDYRTRYYDSRVRRALLQPLLVFKAFQLRPEPSSVEAEPHEWVAMWPDPEAGSAREVRRRLGRYLYSLDADHPRIKDLVGIVKAFAGSSTRLVFYLTPIDYETGERLVGEAFSRSMRAKGELVRRLMAEERVPLSDLMFSLSTSAFSWPGESGNEGGVLNEHLAERGRRYVAARLAERLRD